MMNVVKVVSDFGEKAAAYPTRSQWLPSRFIFYRYYKVPR